jgi:hypothetical protein
MNTPPIYVFLGPTLPVSEARKLLDAQYLPPATMGDVARLVDKQPAVIAIVDGLFDQTPAVWHKEVLFALEKGIRVMGASSMGALRASELHVFGMEGVGKIFEAFREGVLEDDDEVAVAHQLADGDFRVQSEAMVNVRETLRRAHEAGVLSRQEEAVVCALAKEMFYPDRTWRSVLHAARAVLPQLEHAALQAYVSRSPADLKREDAVELLTKIAQMSAAGPIPPHLPSFTLEPTILWQTMLLDELLPGELRDLAKVLPKDLEAEDLRRHLKLQQAVYMDDARDALLYTLARREATRRGKQATPLDHTTRVANIRADSPSMPEASANALALAHFAVENAVEELRHETLGFFALGLAARGEFDALIAEAAEKSQALGALGLREPALADAGLTQEELLRWFERRYLLGEAGAEEHAWSLGYSAAEELLSEALRQFLWERHRRSTTRASGSGS